MKNIIKLTSVSWLFSANLFAGSGIGTTNPPALEQLQDTLAVLNSDLAPLIISDNGDLLLGMPGELRPTLTVAREKSEGSDIVLANVDFERLQLAQSKAKGAATIEVIDIGAQGRSYSIEDGDTRDELVLVDKGDLIRSEVTPQ